MANDIGIKPTKALRKIASLKKKIWGIQGGQGAGQTFAILLLLINHAAANPNKEIFIASAELSKMRITVIKDFLSILKALGIYRPEYLTDGVNYRFPNGSFIKFIGLDKEDIGKGLRCDIIFINEANKVKFNTYQEITSRAKRIIIDFNPNKKYWFHTEVMLRDDCDFISLTYEDNEYLSEQERSEILRYKQRGYDAEGKVISQYWANKWRVYGLGEIGQAEGRIYNWQPIEYSEYLKIDKERYYGNDWGKVDPWAIVEVKYHDGNLYVHELNYASENEVERGMTSAQLHQVRGADDGDHEGLMGWMFSKLGIPKNKVIVCDNNRPNKIRSLRRSGWEYAVAVGGKMDLVNRIGTLSGFNIFYTSTSKNIESEQEAYCYDKDKNGNILETPIDQDNHTIDAICYVVQKMFEMGVIKNL